MITQERPNDAVQQTARAFVTARRRAEALPGFPGAVPTDMASGYQVQEAAIALWGEPVMGWKVGLVPPSLQSALGCERLSGPIFDSGIRRLTAGEPARFSAIDGGFAAIEAELLAVLHHDTAPGKQDWTLAEIGELAIDWHIGIEFAGSPLATINDLGPTVVVSDFGNHSGLAIGPRIDQARLHEPGSLRGETFIDGISVGAAAASALPGGPMEALRFLLNHLAARGRPLKAGQWVSSGAITGVHAIKAGQSGQAKFDVLGQIDVVIDAATAI